MIFLKPKKTLSVEHLLSEFFYKHIFENKQQPLLNKYVQMSRMQH